MCRERATPWRSYSFWQHLSVSATEWRAPGHDPSVTVRRRHLPSFAGEEDDQYSDTLLGSPFDGQTRL